MNKALLEPAPVTILFSPLPVSNSQNADILIAGSDLAAEKQTRRTPGKGVEVAIITGCWYQILLP
jgi:hypothetical protein